jgi:hypothetical protein
MAHFGRFERECMVAPDATVPAQAVCSRARFGFRQSCKDEPSTTLLAACTDRFDFLGMGYRSDALRDRGFEIDGEVPDTQSGENVAVSASLRLSGPNAIDGGRTAHQSHSGQSAPRA